MKLLGKDIFYKSEIMLVGRMESGIWESFLIHILPALLKRQARCFIDSFSKTLNHQCPFTRGLLWGAEPRQAWLRGFIKT